MVAFKNSACTKSQISPSCEVENKPFPKIGETAEFRKEVGRPGKESKAKGMLRRGGGLIERSVREVKQRSGGKGREDKERNVWPSGRTIAARNIGSFTTYNHNIPEDQSQRTQA